MVLLQHSFLPWCKQVSSKPLTTCMAQKGVRGNSSCLNAWLVCSEWNSSSWVSSPVAFRLELTPSALLILRPSAFTGAALQCSWVSSLLTADLGTLRSLLSCGPIPYHTVTHIHTPTYTHTHTRTHSHTHRSEEPCLTLWVIFPVIHLLRVNI
jgi:hypothetical protein